MLPRCWQVENDRDSPVTPLEDWRTAGLRSRMTISFFAARPPSITWSEPEYRGCSRCEVWSTPSEVGTDWRGSHSLNRPEPTDSSPPSMALRAFLKALPFHPMFSLISASSMRQPTSARWRRTEATPRLARASCFWGCRRPTSSTPPSPTQVRSAARFHGPHRGAWYAGFETETSIAEVGFHKRRFLADGRIQGRHAFEYIDFLADFSGLFHTLEVAEQESCLQPDPVPQCYSASQSLANKLLFEGSSGIVYQSVRRRSGTCIACFRPAIVFHPRRGQKYGLTMDASTDSIEAEALP